MIETTFRAMGTDISVYSTSNRPAAVRRAFNQHERRFSRFLPQSELSLMNASTSAWVRLSEPMARIMSDAADLRDRTDGLVDVGVGKAVVDWGYSATLADVRDLAEAPPPVERPQWAIEGNVLHRSQGTLIDLGGIAKGWVCDRVVESGLATIASAGGDLRSVDQSLVVDVIDGHGAVAAEVFVGTGALATSSIAQRRWRVAGDQVHHVIDPKTMAPAATPITSASVVARTAAEAEAGAKAVLLKGVDGLAWADTQPWITQAVAIWHDGNVYGTTIARAS